MPSKASWDLLFFTQQIACGSVSRPHTDRTQMQPECWGTQSQGTFRANRPAPLCQGVSSHTKVTLQSLCARSQLRDKLCSVAQSARTCRDRRAADTMQTAGARPFPQLYNIPLCEDTMALRLLPVFLPAWISWGYIHRSGIVELWVTPRV